MSNFLAEVKERLKAERAKFPPGFSSGKIETLEWAERRLEEILEEAKDSFLKIAGKEKYEELINENQS